MLEDIVQGAEIPLGGKRYPYRLGFQELTRMERFFNLSAYKILHLLNDMQHNVEHVREVIFNGLIGGGMDVINANILVEREVEQADEWLTSTLIAYFMLYSTLYDDDAVTLPDFAQQFIEPLKTEPAESVESEA